MRRTALVLTLALAVAVASEGVLRAQENPAPQGLDEMARRRDRLERSAWPCANLDEAYDRVDWQSETLCFADAKTGREVWRMTATANIRNYYHNDIAVSPWSADGKRMGLQSWRARRGGEVRNLWMVVDTSGRRLRATVNTEGYMHWSPLLPDVYYTFGGARFLGDTGTNNILYKVTVSNDDAKAMKPLITYPVVPGGSYGNRKFISSDGKMFVAMLSVRNPNWRRDGGAEYEMFFTPSIVYPDDEAKALLEKGYTVNRDFGEYLAKPYTKGRYHDAYLLGDGTYYYAIDREIGYWRIRTVGSAPDGGAKFTGDDGKGSFGEIIPEYVRKKGKLDDPWKENQYPGHPGFDRWGEMVNIANYDSVDEKGDFKIGCTVYDFISHRPVTGSWIPQTDGSVHCDWHAYADWCVVSVEKGEFSYGDARIECFPYNRRGENFVVCYTRNFTNGGKAYYNYIRPAQSPDGTKVAFHSDMLNAKPSPDCYWAVCYYPKAPTGLKAEAAPDAAVKLTWQMPTYTRRGWPTKDDPPPPAREIKAFHVWRAPTADGPWKEVGKLDLNYEVNANRAIMEPTNLTFVETTVPGVHFYALTSEEHSGLESRELSEVLKVTIANDRRALSEVAAPAGRGDFWKTPPAAPTNVKIEKQETPGHYRLSWTEPEDDKVRYYNVYYAADRAPESKQAFRIASLARGTSAWLDWLADPEKEGRYVITSVDRQGNESGPVVGEAVQAARRYQADDVPTYVELDKGDRIEFRLHDGTTHTIQLVDYDRTSAQLLIDGQRQTVRYRPQDLPTQVAGMRLGVDITKAWSDRKRFDLFGLGKDCRLFLSDASRPVMSAPEGVYPLSPPVRIARGTAWGGGWLANRREDQHDCHIGYDIYGPLGTRLLAVEDAVVKSVEVDKDYGDMIVVTLEGKRFGWRYLHLMQASVKAGQQVKRGDEVGLIGQSGYCAYPHLHVHMTLADMRTEINPAPFIQDMYARLDHAGLADCRKVNLKAVDREGKPVQWPHYYVKAPDGKTWEVGVHDSTSVPVGVNPFTFIASKKRLGLRGEKTVTVEKDGDEVVIVMRPETENPAVP